MKFEAHKQNITPISFPGSLQDLKKARELSAQFLEVHCPKVEYTEINKEETVNTSQLSKLWGEANGSVVISRKIEIHSFFRTDMPLRRSHTVKGSEIKRGATFLFAVPHLEKADLYPGVGDRIAHGGFVYEVLDVYVDMPNYWMQTNAPTYISCDTWIYRFGEADTK